MDGLTEDFGLLVPVTHIELSGVCVLARLVQLFDDGFGAGTVLVCDEDFDTAAGEWLHERGLGEMYPFFTSISAVALPSPEAPPVK